MAELWWNDGPWPDAIARHASADSAEVRTFLIASVDTQRSSSMGILDAENICLVSNWIGMRLAVIRVVR
jgi:hypothetical protein